MRFWDSSALVPLLVDEPDSGVAAQLMAEETSPTVWWGTPIECASAIRRRERQGTLEREGVATAIDLLDEVRAIWNEILPGEALRDAAERAVAIHPLRSSDALQLSAALVWRDDRSGAPEFVCLDDRLRDAAQREGFRVLPA